MLGTKIGHYLVEAELGRGGMGVVYRARDLRLERTVALKLLSEQSANRSEQGHMMLAEARAAAALNHPGVTTIYEVGEHEGRLFIAMEVVAGKTMRTLLQEGAFESRRLIRFATQIAEALEAVHSHGFRHGDVKPENIVVQADDRIKLLDFGISSRLAKPALTTCTNNTTDEWSWSDRIAGTLAYMAPEVLRGGPADARADLFSLGVILYELATSKQPFNASSTTELIARIVDPSATPPELVASDVPAALEAIIFRLLRKPCEERYPSAHDLRLDLLNLLRDLETGEAAQTALSGKRAVAVLPFRLLTPNKDDEYLGVALADAVIHALGARGEVLVRPASAVERYAKQSVDPLRTARELNVQIVAQGSIQRSADRLRVHIQAWNVSEGTVLYSAKHDAQVHQLFALQDELSANLAAGLGLEQNGAASRPAVPPTKNPHAYELFLRAADRLTRLNRWDIRTAIEMLEHAVQLDPGFPDAWARLAEACVLIGTTQEPHPRWLKRAAEAINKALSLDRHNAEAHCARGRLLWTPAHRFKNRPALRAFREALHIDPGCHAARLWQCLIFLHLGLHEEARSGLMEALASHPDDAFTLAFIGQAAMYRCDFAEAREYNARALSVDVAHIWANGFSPNIALYEGKLTEAEERIKLARLILSDDPWLLSCEALLWALRGERKKAAAWALRSLRPGKAFLHTHHLWHTTAAAYALIEKPAQSIALLRRAGSQGLPNYPAFRDDPLLKPLHSHVGFRNLLTKLKKEWEGYRTDFGNA